VDRYGAWSASHALTPMQDRLTLEAALHVVATRPPRLLLVHFLALDALEHEHGVASAEARWALAHMDLLLHAEGLIDLDASGKVTARRAWVAPGVQVRGYATAEAAGTSAIYRATHGHHPDVPDLGAALVMAGPAVQEGVVLDDVSMLAVAPTAARLLGVTLPGAEGQALVETLLEP
jgi:predicted AlkP superfamily pyrophosphatase or phosphodiesterase